MMLVHPRPKPDESLSTYLLRVSEDNGYQGVAGLIRLAGLPQGPATMHKVLTETGRLPALAETIGRPVADLVNLVYTPEKGVKLPTYAEYRGRRLPLMALRRERVCVCPECLQDDNYGRQEWDWALFAACGRHGKLLLDRCPECGELIGRYRMGVSRCVCGFDFRMAETAAVDISSVSFVQTILEGGMNDGDTNIKLQSLILLASISALWDQLEPDFSQIWTAPVARLNEALNDASAVLRGGDFQGFVRKVGLLRMARWPELGPRGALLPFLTYQSELKDIWGPVDIDGVGRRLRPVSAGQPVSEEETIRLGGVATILGLSDRVVVDSVQFGALAPVRGPKVDGYGHWVFRVADVIGLMRALPKQAPTDNSPVYKMQDITMAAFTHLTKGWGQVLGMIRRGEVRVVAFDEMRGALSLSFQGLPERKAEAKSDQVSVKECAQFTGMYIDAVYRIIKAGILPTTKIGPRYVVKRVDLDAFARTYVFVKELASTLGVNPTNLAEKLMDSGVPAVSGPRVDKGLVYLFRREDVASINLQEVAQKAVYSTLTGRKSIGKVDQLSTGCYMKSTGVAEALGVSIQQLSRIERAGLLKSRMVKDHLANTRLYLNREVERYIEKFRCNPDLITLDQAAAMLGETPGYFHRKWVRAGKLQGVTDGLSQWYRRSEVNTLRMDKQSLLTISEAGNLVGGNNSTIENWRKMGRLKPVSGPKIDGSKWYLYSREDVEVLARLIRLQR